MTWRRRRRGIRAIGLPEGDAVACPLPTRAELGEVWACPECLMLWRYGWACISCERAGRLAAESVVPHSHLKGHRWRPAGWWLRWRAYRARLAARRWHRRMHTTL